MSTSCCRDDRCSAIQHLYLPQACWNYGLPCLKQGCATTVTTDSHFGGGLQSGLQALTFTSHKTMSRLVVAPPAACRLARLDMRNCSALYRVRLALPQLTSLSLAHCSRLASLQLSCPALR